MCNICNDETSKILDTDIAESIHTTISTFPEAENIFMDILKRFNAARREVLNSQVRGADTKAKLKSVLDSCNNSIQETIMLVKRHRETENNNLDARVASNSYVVMGDAHTLLDETVPTEATKEDVVTALKRIMTVPVTIPHDELE